MMFKTLTTLFKAQSFQMEEALIDANSAAILSQKISEAEASHAEAKRMLATMIAQEKTDTKLLNAVESRVTSMIEAATKAMKAGAEDLATDAAGQIGDEPARLHAAFATACQVVLNHRQSTLFER